MVEKFGVIAVLAIVILIVVGIVEWASGHKRKSAYLEGYRDGYEDGTWFPKHRDYDEYMTMGEESRDSAEGPAIQ